MDMARRSFDPFDLLDMPALTNLSAFSMRQGQPQMMSGFASSQGTFRLVFVQSAIDLTSYRSCESWLNAIHAVVAELRAGQPKEEWDGVVVRYTGRPVFVREIAASMQHDISGSVIGTSLIIALLFWLTHRRWLPMLWLLALLALILVATLALGGLVLGTISVVSMGFAAILLGLAVDYAVVHYQEALAHPQLSVPGDSPGDCPEHSLGGHHNHERVSGAEPGGVAWAGATGHAGRHRHRPGGFRHGDDLSAAAVSRDAEHRPRRVPPAWWSYFIPPQQALGRGLAPGPHGRPAMVLTGLVLLAACLVLCFHRPGLDKSGNALRPQRGEAEAALAEITSEMGLAPRPPLANRLGPTGDRRRRRLIYSRGASWQ